MRHYQKKIAGNKKNRCKEFKKGMSGSIEENFPTESRGEKRNVCYNLLEPWQIVIVIC